MLAGGAFVLCLRMLELKIREGILTPAIINLFSSWNYHS